MLRCTLHPLALACLGFVCGSARPTRDSRASPHDHSHRSSGALPSARPRACGSSSAGPLSWREPAARSPTCLWQLPRAEPLSWRDPTACGPSPPDCVSCMAFGSCPRIHAWRGPRWPGRWPPLSTAVRTLVVPAVTPRCGHGWSPRAPQPAAIPVSPCAFARLPCGIRTTGARYHRAPPLPRPRACGSSPELVHSRGAGPHAAACRRTENSHAAWTVAPPRARKLDYLTPTN